MDRPLRRVARVTIEFQTAFIIGASEGDFHSDSTFVADANGLPAIPGSSIAGVLRHRLKKELEKEKEKVKKVFGWQEKDKGHGSLLTISWGCIHDKNNQPVEGILPEGTIEKDLVLNAAAFPSIRDHVRINERGVADKGGKFDERAVPAGNRFTFEMVLECKQSTDEEKEAKEVWDKAIALLCSGSLRLGGKTRRGYGGFTVVDKWEKEFDLRELDDFKAFCGLPVSLKDGLPKEKVTDVKDESVKIMMELEPSGFWMVGGGADPETDHAPVRTIRVNWEGGTGKMEDYFLVPGTAIKGPLAHRTAYYYNALMMENGKEYVPATGNDNLAVKALFGYAKKSNVDKTDESPEVARAYGTAANEEKGQAGRVFIDDLLIPLKADGRDDVQKIVNHVALDRFTCAPIDGKLFSERPLYKHGTLDLRIRITDTDTLDLNVKKAFKFAVMDLTEGLLPIGAGAGKGNGFFKAMKGPEWPTVFQGV